MLIGRDAELAALRAAIDGARAGRSAVVCAHGEAGAGKTALLDAVAAEAATDLLVLRTRGIESEAHLAFAGLAGVLEPLLPLRDRLPEAQARAVGAALALEDAPVAAPFAVAAGVLGLLAAAADERPVLLVADDLQWVDEASRTALLFAARRLDADAVAVLLGVRDGEGLDLAAVEPAERIALGGLAADDALALLAATHPGLAPAVARRLATATGGMPLALMEVPRLLDDAQRAGDAPLEEPLPVGPGLARAFGRRIDALSPAARAALLLAACAEEADDGAVATALRAEGTGDEALAELERSGSAVLSPRRVELHHPLVRAAVVAVTPPDRRRAAHRVLADALPAGSTGRAWHLAAASVGPDPDAARALADAGAQARSRGASIEAGSAFARAAELGEDDDERARLLLEAAGAMIVGGRPVRAVELARRGEALAHDGLLAIDLRATAARAASRMGDPLTAAATLVAEADRLEGEPLRAAMYLLEAAAADMTGGRLWRMIDRASRAQELAAEPFPPLAGLAATLIAEARLALGQSEVGDAALEAAHPGLLAFVPGTAPAEIVGMAAHSSLWVERFDRSEALLARLVGTLREAGAFGELVYPLAVRAQLGFRLGRWPAALADATEAVQLGTETAQHSLLAYALGVLAEVEAGLGRGDACREHALRAAAMAEGLGGTSTAAYGHGALAVLALGRGAPEEAVRHARDAARAEATSDNDEPGIIRYAPDLAEALWRVGDVPAAVEVLERLERQADRPGHSWTQAVVSRLRGLTGPDEEIDEHFAAALAAHEETHQPFETARTRLLHGERLRRARRPTDARSPLSEAIAAFERLGAVAWAERARVELRAAGGQGPALAPLAAVADLTPQELQIAMLAAQGQTNREVGAGLFLSPKTVEHHLSRTFRKLDIRRRSELAGALAAAA